MKETQVLDIIQWKWSVAAILERVSECFFIIYLELLFYFKKMYVGKSCCLSFPFSKKKNEIKSNEIWSFTVTGRFSMNWFRGFAAVWCITIHFYTLAATDSAISQLPGIVIECKQPIPFPPPKKMCCWAAETFRASTLLLYKYFFLNRMFYIGNTRVPPPHHAYLRTHTIKTMLLCIACRRMVGQCIIQWKHIFFKQKKKECTIQQLTKKKII